MSAGKMTHAEALSLARVGYVSRVLLVDGGRPAWGRTALGVITIGVSVVLAWRVDAGVHEAHEPQDDRLWASVGAGVSRGTAHRFARSPGHVRAARLS